MNACANMKNTHAMIVLTVLGLAALAILLPAAGAWGLILECGTLRIIEQCNTRQNEMRVACYSHFDLPNTSQTQIWE